MASQKTLDRVQALIWVLAYGGLLTFVLGLATRSYDETLSWPLMVGGLVVAAVGFVLVYVRSRMHLTDPP